MPATADVDAAGGPAGGTMQVVACAADGSSRLERRPVPGPAAGEVLLALGCCGLCGTDLFKIANRTVADGTVLGHEVVGTVVAAGPGVESVAVGQRVVVPHHVACGVCPLCERGADTMCATFQENLLSPGGFAERVLVGRRAVERAAWAVPDRIPDAAAVFMEPAACVARGVAKAELGHRGGSALVVGGGSMGLLHLLVLRGLDPACRVVVCEPVAERRALAVELGAWAACPPEERELAAAVRSASAGQGVDAAFDTVGGSGPLCLSLRALRPGGTVVLFAHAAVGELAGFELNPLFKTEQRVVATYSGGRADQRRVVELLEAGALDPEPLVTHRLPLGQFDRAVELVSSRQALKILLEGGPS